MRKNFRVLHLAPCTMPYALCLLGAMLFALCSSAQAQQPSRIVHIGFLGSSPLKRVQVHVAAFRQGLRELGYVEGHNLRIEYRYAEGKFDRLPKLADELVRLNVDVIFAQAAPSIRAAKNATQSIPIFFETLADPVSAGFVNSLAQPGANLTGIAGLGPELSGKRLELLKEIVPRLAVVAVLANPRNPNFQSVLKESKLAASALKLRLQVAEVREPDRLAEAFSAMSKERAEALSVMPDSMLLSN